MTSVIISNVIEDSAAQVLARVLADGVAVVQADISAISYSVFDHSALGDPVVGGHDGVALTVADVVFDTLQTDARWTKDATGYNFRHAIAGTAFPTGGHRYRIEYTFTPISGNAWIVAVDVDATAVMGS